MDFLEKYSLWIKENWMRISFMLGTDRADRINSTKLIDQQPAISLDDDMSESSSATASWKDLRLVAQIIDGAGMHEPWPHHYILF